MRGVFDMPNSILMFPKPQIEQTYAFVNIFTFQNLQYKNRMLNFQFLNDLIQFLKNYEHPNYSRTMKTKTILLILKEPEFVENISVLIESNDSDGGFEVMDDISFLAYIEEFEK